MIAIIPENQITQCAFEQLISCVIIPFTECNLNCKFCDTDKTIKKEINSYKECLNRFKHLMNQIPNHYPINISLQGGELLQDKFKDNDLEIFLSEITQDSRVQPINIITNLCYKNIDRVINIVRNYGVKLSVSYDFQGRYHKQYHQTLVNENLKRLIKENIKFDINIVAHKSNIDYIIDHPDEFDRLAGCASIGFEKYNDVGDSFYTITQSDIDRLIDFIKNYSNVYFNAYFDQKRNVCSMYEIEITPFYTQWQCCDKLQKMQQFFATNRCLSCKNLKLCAKPCFNETLLCPNKK